MVFEIETSPSPKMSFDTGCPNSNNKVCNLPLFNMRYTENPKSGLHFVQLTKNSESKGDCTPCVCVGVDFLICLPIAAIARCV